MTRLAGSARYRWKRSRRGGRALPELNNGYFRDAVGYLQEFEREDMNISLFDLMGEVSG